MKIKVLVLSLVLSLTACSSASKVLNPFYEPPSNQALLGAANDHAINPESSGGDKARKALEQMRTYEEAHMPGPNKPVVRPAVYRVMWIPDHLNRHGDLVPAHYYYLKVLDDRPAVTDAFELQDQLNVTTNRSNLPFTYKGR